MVKNGKNGNANAVVLHSPAINSRASSSQPQSTGARTLPNHNQQSDLSHHSRRLDRSHLCPAVQQPPRSSLCPAVPLLCPEVVTCKCPLPAVPLPLPRSRDCLLMVVSLIISCLFDCAFGLT
ncbi:hypothetical protein ACFE04_018304 [Oxalis oulophora]